MQVRQLQTLGFPIKRDILAEVDTAGRFYRHGLVLKQVANFYNDIATQIIPCQKPMLLAVRCHVIVWCFIAAATCLQVTPAARPLACALCDHVNCRCYLAVSSTSLPLLAPLQDAQDFEAVLLNPKDGMGKAITWENAAALEGYVRRLQAVAQQLTERNRWTRSASCCPNTGKPTQLELPQHCCILARC